MEAAHQLTPAEQKRFDSLGRRQQIIDKYRRGLLTEAKVKRLADEEASKKEQTYKKYDDKFIRVANKILDKYLGYGKRLTNTELMQFVRDMKIKLYSSTDFQNFTEFSA